MVGARKHDIDGEDGAEATRWAMAAAPIPRQKAKDIQVVQQDKKRRARTGRGYMRWLALLAGLGRGSGGSSRVTGWGLVLVLSRGCGAAGLVLFALLPACVWVGSVSIES